MTPKRRNRRRSKQRVEPFSLVETLVVTMADQRTMEELLRAPTEGYAEAIVVPPIPAEHFELKHNLINLVTSKQFFGFEKEDPHAHIRYYNKITSTLKYKDVPETSIKLMLFPFSIDGPARIWLDKEPSRSILTWDDLDLLRACPHHGFTELHQLDTFHNGLNLSDQDSLNSAAGGNLLERSAQDVTMLGTTMIEDQLQEDVNILEEDWSLGNARNKQLWATRSILTWDDLVSKFINHFFPPSKTTNLRNEISNFLQRFDKTFYEAWDRFKDLLRACPHHGFTKLHQLDTFHNGLNLSDQDSLNSAAGGNLLERSAQDVLKIIENKSKVRNSRNKQIVSQVKASLY
ncbi:reverse transcriptase domain-containing protein [Tanacetum coccineum]